MKLFPLCLLKSVTQVVRQLKRALDTDVKNINVTWEHVPRSELQDSSPEDKNIIFMGGKLVLYSLLEGQSLSSEEKAFFKFVVVIRFANQDL